MLVMLQPKSFDSCNFFFSTGRGERDADAGQELRQGVGGGGEDDAGAAGHQERRQAGPQAAPRRKG